MLVDQNPQTQLRWMHICSSKATQFSSSGWRAQGHKIRFFALQFDATSASVPASSRLGAFMDNGTDRREARRFSMNLPLSILPTERASAEVAANLRDVSYRGLYFFASEPFEAGREIAFVITLPKDLLKSSDVKIRCTGTVVRVDPGENGNLGIAAKIDRYEFVPCVAA